MQEHTKIYIEGIGPVLIRRSKRARHMRIRVEPVKGVTVVVPPGIPERYILKFLNEKKEWVNEAKKRQETILKKNTIFRDENKFNTRMHSLYLCKHDKKTIKSRVGQSKIIVWYPDIADIEDYRVQNVIRKAILEAWRVEAKKILPQRVDELAQKFNFNYARLTIKNAKTRWGSCSSQNNINLNLQLMRLPDELIDYVILHELNHTQHRHHQKTFWLSLEQILPGARKLDKQLNKYHLEYW